MPRPDKVTVVSVGVLTVLASALRVWRLTAVGFRGDESVYAGQAGLLAGVDGLSRWFIPASRGNSNFLIYQWVVSLSYRIVGVSDFTPRLVSAIFSTMTVLLVYAIARQLYEPRAAFLAGFFLAVSGYAVGLGRLALLDATACFFVTLAMFCLIKWQNTSGFRWLGFFVVATAVAMQAKVTSVLIIPVALLSILISGEWRRLTRRHTAVALVLSAISLLPAILQIAGDQGGILGFLSASTTRASNVRWYYYFKVLWSAEGVLMAAILALGLAAAIVRRHRANVVPLLWVAVFGLFLQFYPLKASNYLLPVIPALALLAGWGISRAIGRLSRNAIRTSAFAALVAAVCATQFGAVRTAVTDDGSAGMREAAQWLQAQGAGRAGAMTLSHGSGQYVLSYYGGIDAYPYGRFRLATIVPGGRIIRATARSGGKVPLDWVDYWPSRLIAEGKISYLVYSTPPLDDPPEQDQVASTVTERQFRSLIPQYGGSLVHTVYWHHEARVYVYRVTKRLAAPVVSVQPIAGRVAVHAKGFVVNSPLTLAYHGAIIARPTADATGSAVVNIPVPDPGQSEYHLTVTDAEGNSASVTGLPSARLIYRADNGVVRVFGIGYQPQGAVLVTYGGKRLGITRARADGTFSWTFHLPVDTHPRYRIRATDQAGHLASATGLQTPAIAFIESGHNADVSGAHYLPSSTVTVTYRGRIVGKARTNQLGAFRLTFGLPKWTQPAYQLIGVDSIGRQASVTGLERR